MSIQVHVWAEREKKLREEIAQKIETLLARDYCKDDSFMSVQIRLALHEAAAIARNQAPEVKQSAWD